MTLAGLAGPAQAADRQAAPAGVGAAAVTCGNSYGNRWTWVRGVGGNSIGWVYNEYLNPKGTTKACP